MHKQARERYKVQIPPGYMDQAKGEPDCFGDYIGWVQLIEITKAEGKGVIFVCDDRKEDWWEKTGGRTVGIRYGLKEEFWNQANKPIHMYDFLQFLRYAKEYLADEIEISDELIEQASRQQEFGAEERRQASQKREPSGGSDATDNSVKASGGGKDEPEISDLKAAPPGAPTTESAEKSAASGEESEKRS